MLTRRQEINLLKMLRLRTAQSRHFVGQVLIEVLESTAKLPTGETVSRCRDRIEMSDRRDSDE
jgi:hypothetical protein